MPFTYFSAGLNLQDNGEPIIGVSVLNFANGILGISGNVASFSAPIPPAFSIEKGDDIFTNPSALSIVSETATIKPVSTLPTIVQFQVGQTPGLTLPNPVTVGNLLVYLNYLGLDEPGFDEKIRINFDNGVFVAGEKIATSTVPPVMSVVYGGPNSYGFLLEISGSVEGNYTQEAVVNTDGTITSTVDKTFTDQGASVLFVAGSGSLMEGPYGPDGVIGLPSPGGRVYRDGIIVNPNAFTSGEIVFSFTNIDTDGTCFCFYQADPSKITVELTI
jgi:hypothetical protein